MDQIQRDGQSWQRQPTGEWLRFDVSAGAWVPSGPPPPPPPPPPPGVFVGAAPPRKRPSRDVDPRVLIALAVVFAIALLSIGGYALFGGSSEPVATALLGSDTQNKASGEDSAKKSASDGRTPKERFIFEADSLCADFLTELGPLKRQIPTTLAEAETLFKQLRTVLEGIIEKGRAIKAPPGARKGWKAFVGTKDQLAVYDRLVAATLSGDTATIEALDRELKAKGASDRRWAKRYGLKVCSHEDVTG